MSDYSAVAPPQQNFNQSSAFAAALQRAKQVEIAAKINPAGDSRGKRPLEDGSEPDAKKNSVLQPPQGPPPVGRPLQAGMGGPVMGGGPQVNEDIKVPDKMVGLRMNNMNQNMPGGGGGGGGGGGRNFVEIMIPGPKVGLIIGKGGETIKQLQEKSGAKMVVIQDGPNQEQEKPLRISGDAQKVEYAKQLVYDLIAEKEIQNFNRRGGGNNGGSGGSGNGVGRNENRPQDQYNDYGNGGQNETEVLVPRPAVGVVIGKGGDMIKKIQAETGARVQFQQAREEGPGDRRCYLAGTAKQVEQARQRIEELIDSVIQRENGDNRNNNRGGGGRGGNRGGQERFDRGNNRNGSQDYGNAGGWDERRQQAPQEVTFSVPSSKCGVIIGRGGETIKQINQQSGAYCELDRRSQNSNSNEKTFTIKGDPEQIESAKRIISEKVQMALNFVSTNTPQISNAMPTAYPGMAPQGYNPGWGMPQYQQQWGQPNQGNDGQQPGGAAQVQVNPSTGQPDYSLQWAEYYRSLGMHREAEMIEQQAKTKGVTTVGGTNTQTAPQAVSQAQTAAAAAAAAAAAVVTQQNAAAAAAGVATNGAQPDYSVQWAEYYRSIGKHKEAEAIETQMKNKQGGVQQQAVVGGNPPTATGNYQQQAYGAYQAPQGYYGGQPQTGVPGNVSQPGYSFPGYGYGGQTANAAPSSNTQEN